MPYILFVDDDSVSLHLMTKAVAMLGHEVVCEPSPRRALLQAAENRPTLILVDLNMMEMSGIEFTRAIRKQAATRNIPILIYSASQDQEDKDLAAAAGANGYLHKPLNLGDLSQAIEKFSQ